MSADRHIVLVDTNVILEAHSKRCWAALCGGHQVETVEKCVEETQTGFQQRRPEQNIDERQLRASLANVHPVDELALAEVLLMGGGVLHAGERHLWAHALTRQDAWVLCGPDTASLRFGHEARMRDRIVTLEGLLADIGFRPPVPIQPQFGRRHHEGIMNKLVLGIL